MGANFKITSIKTRGTTNTGFAGVGWTETFKIGCSTDGISYSFAGDTGILEANLDHAYVFDGNSDGSGVVTNDVSDFELECQYFRFYPYNISGGGAVVVELFDGKKNQICTL